MKPRPVAMAGECDRLARCPGRAQELESILVGPIPLGLNKIVFQVGLPPT